MLTQDVELPDDRFVSITVVFDHTDDLAVYARNEHATVSNRFNLKFAVPVVTDHVPTEVRNADGFVVRDNNSAAERTDLLELINSRDPNDDLTHRSTVEREDGPKGSPPHRDRNPSWGSAARRYGAVRQRVSQPN